MRQLAHQVTFLFAIAKVGFATYLAYPAGVGMVFLSYPIVIMMYRYVFGAVYSSGKEIASYNLPSILTYVTVSWLLNTFYMTPTGRQLGARIRDGQVAMDLLKPVNLMAIYFGQSLGRTFFRLVFATIPLLLIFALFGGILPPSSGALAPFIVAVFIGYTINFMMDYMIGLIAFYFGYNNGIRWGIRMVMNLAGGMVIPLNYFPEPLQKIFTYFPTQYMFYKPVQIYLGRESGPDAWLNAGVGLCWLLVLIAGAQVMQWDGTRRMSLSGG